MTVKGCCRCCYLAPSSLLMICSTNNFTFFIIVHHIVRGAVQKHRLGVKHSPRFPIIHIIMFVGRWRYSFPLQRDTSGFSSNKNISNRPSERCRKSATTRRKYNGRGNPPAAVQLRVFHSGATERRQSSARYTVEINSPTPR